MTKFLQKSFSVGGASTDAYRDNYERIFSKPAHSASVLDSEKSSQQSVMPLPDPLERNFSNETERERTTERPERLVAIVVRLPLDDFGALHQWASSKEVTSLDPDVAHTVLMAAADAAVAK